MTKYWSKIGDYFSNTPYSEPDNDCSPCNDTDWDWGGGNKAGGATFKN